MAKVEIELADLVSLQDENLRLQNEIGYLRQQLSKTSPEEVKNQARMLFETYISKTFQQLGFNSEDKPIIDYRDLDSAMNHEDCVITLGASVRKGWRRAFLEIGVVTKNENDGKES